MSLETQMYARCRRKVAYFSEAIALEAAKKSSRREKQEIIPYKCQFDDTHWHIGRKEHAPRPETEVFHKEGDTMIPSRKLEAEDDLEKHRATHYILDFQGQKLAKLVDNAGNRYIFSCPSDIKQDAKDIITRGKMVAVKDGRAPYLDKHGQKSPHYQMFNLLYPITVKADFSLVKFHEALIKAKENMVSLEVKPAEPQEETFKGSPNYTFTRKGETFYYRGNAIVLEGSLHYVYKKVTCKDCGRDMRMKSSVSFKNNRPFSVSSGRYLDAPEAWCVRKGNQIVYHCGCKLATPQNFVKKQPINKPVLKEQTSAAVRVQTVPAKPAVQDVVYATLIAMIDPTNKTIDDATARGLAYAYILTERNKQ